MDNLPRRAKMPDDFPLDEDDVLFYADPGWGYYTPVRYCTADVDPDLIRSAEIRAVEQPS